MKLRVDCEVEVPDEVGARLLADQAEKRLLQEFTAYITMGNWAYNLRAPMRWDLTDKDPSA